MEDAKPRGVLKKPARRDLLRAGLAAAGVAAGQVSTGWPANIWFWLLLVGGSLACGVLAFSATADFLLDRLEGAFGSLQPVALRRLGVGLAIMLTAVLVGLTLVRVAVAAQFRIFGCPASVQLRLLTTPEGLQPARELVAAFEKHTATSQFQCPRTNIYGYAAPARLAQQALNTGWTGEHLASIGPRPDLWLPGTSALEVKPNARLSTIDSVSMGFSPVVIAVPLASIGNDVRLPRRDVTWAKALDELQARRLGPVRPDPTQSVTGLLATIALYEGALGDRAGEKVPLERRLEMELDQGGYPIGDELAVLCRHLRAPAPHSGVIVSEQQLLRFNDRRELGGACASVTSPERGRGFIDVRPSDTLALDHPVARLEWTDSSAEQIEQGRAFQEWLGSEQGRAAVRAAGLHPRGEQAVPPAPKAGQVEPVLRAHAAAKRPGRVLLAVDTSGSMRQRTGEGGPSRFEVARKGVESALSLMGERDEVGLWVFPDVGGRREHVPVGKERQRMLSALAAISPAGPTPLYRTIVDGAQTLRGTNSDLVKAIVVLTDGVDEGSGIGRDQVMAGVTGSGVRVFVIAVGEASCEPLQPVVEASGGSCRRADFATLDAALSEVFALLWKGA